MAAEAQILAFVGNSFRSVWTMEVLTFLQRRRDNPPSADEILSELRVSKLVVAQSLEQLCALGLAFADAERIVLQPANEHLEDLVSGAVELYGRRPDLVRRTIVSRTSPAITAFVDAFKLRKD